MSIETWNERYRSGERGNPKPAPAVVEAAAGAVRPGRALDLACGAGRNALFLARNGWEVTAVDGSTEAIAIASKRAGRLGLRIATSVLDLEQLPLPFEDAACDLVCIILYLQASLFHEAKRLVRPGGAIVIAAKTAGVFAIQLPQLVEYFHDDEIVAARTRDETAELIVRRRE
ncbi:MAG: class I SAM-dependent methyltransferase [Acidobacteriota bacterium]